MVSRPLYLHVIDWIKEQIREGRFASGERLPSEFELAKQLGVSRSTLREALRILEDENVVIRRHGVGTFVHPRPLFSSGIEELFSVTDMIAAHGKRPGTHYLFTGRVKAQAEDREKLNVSEKDEVVVIERLRTADDEPVVYCIDKIPAHLLPDPCRFIIRPFFSSWSVRPASASAMPWPRSNRWAITKRSRPSFPARRRRLFSS